MFTKVRIQKATSFFFLLKHSKQIVLCGRNKFWFFMNEASESTAK